MRVFRKLSSESWNGPTGFPDSGTFLDFDDTVFDVLARMLETKSPAEDQRKNSCDLTKRDIIIRETSL